MQRSTVVDALRERAATAPDDPLITFEDTILTAAAFDQRTTKVAQALTAAGVEPGDRVAVLAENRPEHLELLLGAGKARAAYLPLNWRLAPGEIAYILDHSGAATVVVERQLLPVLDAATAATPMARGIVVFDDPGERGYERWLSAAPSVANDLQPHPDDVAMQMYTSGTTGLPKGVLLSHRNLGEAVTLARSWDFDRDSIALVCMPMFHMSGTGWAITALTAGGQIVVLREPDPAQILRAVAGHRITHALLVPALMQMVLDHDEATGADLSTLRLIVYGGSPISDELLSRGLQRLGCGFLQLYGLTESSGTGTMLQPDEHRRGDRLLGSVGRPADGTELRVVDPVTGEDCPPGQVGEVWLRSAMVMTGYWQAPQETAEVIRPDGWLRTGDAGYLDDDGYLFLHDRVKDMIVSGGENVYPAEVERVIQALSDVLDVAVVAAPHEQWGETVKAVVVARPGSVLEAGDVIAHCRERLAHYKCPTSVDFVAELPRNASGKVLKRELRDRYWQGHTRRIH